MTPPPIVQWSNRSSASSPHCALSRLPSSAYDRSSSQESESRHVFSANASATQSLATNSSVVASHSDSHSAADSPLQSAWRSHVSVQLSISARRVAGGFGTGPASAPLASGSPLLPASNKAEFPASSTEASNTVLGDM